MPELPEVETMVRGIRPHAEGHRLQSLTMCPSPCQPISVIPDFATITRQLIGQRVVSVTRRGKRAIFTFENQYQLVIEPRMSGLLLVADPPNQKHLRLELQFLRVGNGRRVADCLRIWFWDQRGLGTLRMYGPGELEATLKLGPDALEATLADWKAISQKTNRPVKVALLDQKLIAGIGNLYASEILHLARISPHEPFANLTPRQIARLHEATREVLLEAIRYEGSTLGDGTYRNTLNQDGGYQNSHRVYDRADERCPTCKTGTIHRIVQAQRSTFHCPKCQPRRR